MDLAAQRLRRLREVLGRTDQVALLTAEPINIFYATGLRNMSIFSMMAASRFALIAADGPVIVCSATTPPARRRAARTQRKPARPRRPL